MLQKFAGTILFIFNSVSYALDKPDYCDDLYKVACAPGTTTDISGFSHNGPDHSVVGSAIADAAPKLNKFFMAKLQDPKQAYFKKMTADTLGYSNSPECINKEEKVCNQKIAEGLSAFAISGVFSGNYSFPRKVPAEDLKLLLDNTTFTEGLSLLKSQVSEKIDSKKLAQNVEKNLFPKAKDLLIAKIQSMSIEPKAKELMISRINSIPIKFGGDPCARAETGPFSVQEKLTQNAMYFLAKNEIYFCNGLFFAGNSDFYLIQTLVHELSHSIDPCGMQHVPSSEQTAYSQTSLRKAASQYAIPNLLKCLRSKKSVEAKRNENHFPLSKLIPGDAKIFCHSDQIGESIAEWFGFEVAADYLNKISPKISVPDALKAISNIIKPFCEKAEKEDKNFDEHPTNRDSTNKILLANPKIRKLLGCSTTQAKVGYCDGENPEPYFGVSGSITPAPSSQKKKGQR